MAFISTVGKVMGQTCKIRRLALGSYNQAMTWHMICSIECFQELCIHGVYPSASHVWVGRVLYVSDICFGWIILSPGVSTQNLIATRPLHGIVHESHKIIIGGSTLDFYY